MNLTLLASAAPFWMPDLTANAKLAPLWALVGTILAVLLASLIVGRRWRLCGAIAFAGAVVTAYLAWKSSATMDAAWAGYAPEGRAPMLVADRFSYFFILLLSIFLALVTALWVLGQDLGRMPQDVAHRDDAPEFFVLLLGSALGMALMVSTTNLLMIILAVELASLPSYALAGFRKKFRPAAEASVKYVLFGAVTSAVMIYGASLLYGCYGTLDLVAIGRTYFTGPALSGTNLLAGVALFGVMIGIAFKVSAVPFHFWCPDVFEGAAIEVTTWLSVASKAAGIGLMLRVVSAVGAGLGGSSATFDAVNVAVAVMAAVTCTVGNLSAYRQTNIKRLLAYSSIAHAGYMLMAVAIAWKPADAADIIHPAFSVIATYLVVYVFMNLGAFGVAAMVYWATGREDLDAYRGLGRRSPWAAVMLAVCLFSLVGLPPLGGFMAKWYLLAALYDAGNRLQQNLFYWLIFIAIFNTLFSLYYYLRVIYYMFLKDDPDLPSVRMPPIGQAVVTLCALALLLTGTFYAGTLKEIGDHQASALYAADQAPQPLKGTIYFTAPTRMGTRQ